MKRILHSCLIMTLAVSTLAVSATAEDTQDAAGALAESRKLAPEHAYLKKHLGKWTAEMKSFYTNPDKPTVSKGTAAFTAVYGGRYLQQIFKGEYAGTPFEGRGVTGFDKAKKKFVSTWIDSIETGIASMEGTYDEKTKTMTEFGVTQSPQGEMKVKNVTKDVDDDTMVFSMYMVLPDGTEMLGMEITYHRVK